MTDVARLLCRWAVALTPADQRVWAEAMRREIDEVADGRAALDWALGCFWVCLLERMRSMRALMIAVRLALAGVCAVFAAGTALSVALVLAWRTDSAAALERLQGSLAGDDAARIAPLLADVTNWQLAGALLAMALYLIAGALIAFRRASAPWVYTAVVALGAVTMTVNHMRPAYQEIFTPAELRTDYIGLALQVAVAAVMFWAARRGDAGRVV